jgi:WD40 repeat protein
MQEAANTFKVGYNWKYGRCSVKTLKGHTNGVTCLQLDDNILATGSYDATIKICMFPGVPCRPCLKLTGINREH